jgi:hypothetical protein
VVKNGNERSFVHNLGANSGSGHSFAPVRNKKDQETIVLKVAERVWPWLGHSHALNSTQMLMEALKSKMGFKNYHEG